MIVANVVGKKALQVALIDRDDVIQQVAPTTFNPPLRDPVLPRTPERGSNRPDSHRANRDRNPQAIFGISIKDQEPGSRFVGEGFAQLLNNPTARGMSRDIEVQHAPTMVADDEKAVEHTERDRGDRKEVHGRDGFAMVTQEGEPTLGRLVISGSSAHPTGNGSLGNIETQHQEFTVDARRAPG